MLRTLISRLQTTRKPEVSNRPLQSSGAQAITCSEARMIYAKHLAKPLAQRLEAERDESYRAIVNAACRIVSGWPGD